MLQIHLPSHNPDRHLFYVSQAHNSGCTESCTAEGAHDKLTATGAPSVLLEDMNYAINTSFFIDESVLKILIKEVNRIEENFNLNEVIDKEYIDILMKDGNLELSKTYDFLNNLSTGRISKWNFVYKYHNKKIIGYGPNMDRIFFSENISFNDQKPVSKSIIGANDAASGIVYQYVSSGLIGLIGIIIFYLIIIINFINKKLYLEKSVNERIFISIFILLTLRIIFENSYMIFGIDYLFMIIGLQVLTKKTKISY